MRFWVFTFWLKYQILTIKTAFIIHDNKWVIELTTQTQQYYFAELKCTPPNIFYKHHLHVYITLLWLYTLSLKLQQTVSHNTVFQINTNYMIHTFSRGCFSIKWTCGFLRIARIYRQYIKIQQTFELILSLNFKEQGLTQWDSMWPSVGEVLSLIYSSDFKTLLPLFTFPCSLKYP